MIALRSWLLPAVVLAFGTAALCSDARAGGTATTYVLSTPPSELEIGCQGPCACPIISYPTYGSFDLVELGSDPLYTNYAVERFIASFNNGPGAVAITGSGRYKIGGEVALMQQMTLDLEIQGRPTQHFDSGLVPVGAPFPRIHVACAVHGFACYDTVLVVDTKPMSTVGGPSPTLPAFGIIAVRPNPFGERTAVVVSLARSVPIELTVLDVAGRTVRSLASGQVAGAGPSEVAWDGRRDDGSMAPAGVYWVWMRWPEGSDRRRVVKLD
jgi:hypothetical protein